MELPKTWGKWHDKIDFAIKDQCDLRGLIGICRMTDLRIEHSDVTDKESPAAMARKRLAELPDEAKLNEHVGEGWKVTICERRLIKVDGVDAVWDATSSQTINDRQYSLSMTCLVRWGGADLKINALYRDNRPERTAEEFDQARAEVLNIIQSFRFVSAADSIETDQAKVNACP
jgi:hypothetical protein